MRISRTVRLALALAAVFSAEPAAADAKLKIVATLQDLASLAQLVGGDRVETFALAKGYQDPHYVDAKPSFVLQLSRADLLVVAGLELEIGYLPPLVDQSRNARIRPGGAGYLDASAGCEILGRPDRRGDAGAWATSIPYGNPHYWTDPENGRVIARAIAARLTQLDPAGAAVYAANLARFRGTADGEGARVARAAGPYAGARGRHLPRLLAELRPPLPARRRRPRRAEARHPAHSEPHSGDHQPDPRAEGTGHPGRAVLRHQDARLHRARVRGAGGGALSLRGRRAGDRRLLRALRPRPAAAGRGAGRRSSDHPRSPPAGVRRRADPDRNPRLPRRPRGGARGDLRRPLAGADRRPRHHRRLPSRLRPALGRLVRLLAGVHLPRRRGLRALARAPPDADPAGGDDRHRLRGFGGGRDPGDVEGDLRRPSTSRRCWSATSSRSPGPSSGGPRRSTPPSVSSTTCCAVDSCSSR